MRPEAPITDVRTAAYVIPTDAPESDGTIEWSSTGMVCVWIEAGGETGFGYSYAAPAAAQLVDGVLAEAVKGRTALDIPAIGAAMDTAVRNVGRPGIAAMAISAVDIALWDLKARLLGLPVADLLGRARPDIAAYGSGGFTSYDDETLCRQLSAWAAEGLFAVKMKVGREPARDRARVEAARAAIGDSCELFVDANGAHTPKTALAQGAAFADQGVTWFEEPVTSDDLDGLRTVREQGPPGMTIAAGEYGYSAWYFRRMLEAQAVDVLQADATRCGGFSGFKQADALTAAHHLPLSAHCAPSLHVHACCAARNAVHLEWFHDHCRIERMLLDGAPLTHGGRAAPPDAAGLGLTLKESDAAPYEV
ncbi:enolase C-terminal domain-like protein [Parvularcula oceani]|uniref:enolase C-terminal domain-like protein n=1 Tax=Parvularcula oceani TaxID=1247963 RepID=UPI0004E279F9